MSVLVERRSLSLPCGPLVHSRCTERFSSTTVPSTPFCVCACFYQTTLMWLLLPRVNPHWTLVFNRGLVVCVVSERVCVHSVFWLMLCDCVFGDRRNNCSRGNKSWAPITVTWATNHLQKVWNLWYECIFLYNWFSLTQMIPKAVFKARNVSNIIEARCVLDTMEKNLRLESARRPVSPSVRLLKFKSKAMEDF